MPKSLRGCALGYVSLVIPFPHMPLFRSNRGTRVSYDALHYRWLQSCKAANLIDLVDGKEQAR